MIIGNHKEQVIRNIQKCVEAGMPNSKVEVDDPQMPVEEQVRIAQEFLQDRHTVSYHVCNAAARGMVGMASRILNRSTTFVGLDQIRGIHSGAVVTSNHFNPLDNTLVRRALQKTGGHRLYIVSQATNLAMKGWIGFLMNYTDILPVCRGDRKYMSGVFERLIGQTLRQKKWILIYPEQEMWFNYRKPRPPKRGAYYYAAKHHVPVISLFVEIRDLEEKDTEQFYKVRYVVHVLPPIYPEEQYSVRENSFRMMQKDYAQKKEAYEKAYGKPIDAAFEPEDIAGWISGETRI